MDAGRPRSLARVVVVLACLSGACRSHRSAEIAAALPAALDAAPAATEAVSAGVRAFYAARQTAPAWVADRRITGADVALEALGSATAHGLVPADYDEVPLTAEVARLSLDHDDRDHRTRQLAELDVRLTTALLTLGRDVAIGRTPPDAIGQRSKTRRDEPDLAGTLAAAVSDDRVVRWLDAIKPPHPEYAALQQALVESRGLDAEAAARIALNLERWRWMPDDLGSRHLLVNIPSYLLMARADGRTVMEMRVVVGKRGQETPVFSGEMETVVFSPYWNVPESIAGGETAPAAARDPAYLDRNAMDVFRRTDAGVEPVDPSAVDWNNADELEDLFFRQRPGPHNALGHVKFLFPNRFNVYLHDTPADALFARPTRAFSHGCVRVEAPVVLAKHVLGGDPIWDDRTIKAAMYSGVEKHVKLDRPIPVHIVYFTVWPDRAGGVQFYDDVYGWDGRQVDAEPDR